MRYCELFEARVEPTNYGYWIDPEGAISVVGYQDHHRALQRLTTLTMRQAFEAGWVRVIAYCDWLAIEINETIKPKALRALKKVAASNKFDNFTIDYRRRSDEMQGRMVALTDRFETRSKIAFMDWIDARAASRELVTEVWLNTYRIEDGPDIDVFVNPSKTEFLKLIARHEREHGTVMDWPLRAFVTSTDLYVWDAYVATHSDMSHHKIPQAGGYLYLNRDGIMFNDLNMEDSEGGELPYGPYIRSYFEATMVNPTIKRLYGPNPHILGIDDENLAGIGTRFEVTRDFVEKYCEKRES